MKTMRRFKTPFVWLVVVAMVATIGAGFVTQFAGQ